MDDIKSLSAAWCEEARGLTGAGDPGPVDGHAQRVQDSSSALTARLDAIGEGIRLRRKLDGLVPDEESESGRREVVCLLAELQKLASEDLASLRPGTTRHREVATRVKEWLVEARVAARNAANRPPVRAPASGHDPRGASRRPRMVERRGVPARQ